MTSPTWKPRALLALCSLLGGIPAAAQSSGTGAGAPLITGHDIAIVSGATLGAAALSLVDIRVARAFSDSAMHMRHPGYVTAAKRASLATETVLMITGGSVWALSRMRKDAGTADVALHSTEAVASAAMFIQVVRGVLGRARPYVINEVGERRDSDPYDFNLFHGFTSFNYRSFPSMHAMASMAVASALSQEMRIRNTPRRDVIAPMLYTAAAMPSLGRMVLDEHWTSDIALGAFLGVLAGQKAVLYSHEHPGNRIDRNFLRPDVSATFSITPQGASFRITPF